MRYLPVLPAIVCIALCPAQEHERGPGGDRGPRGGFRFVSPLVAALDTNRDGTISADEIRNASKTLIALDKNSDGQLTEEELRPQFPGAGREQSAGSNPEDLVQTLMAFDKNKDGKLSKDELPERMQGMLERGDANHDSFLSPDEIRKLASSQQPSGGDSERRGRQGGGFLRNDPVFGALDLNHDGILSAEEIRKAPQSLLALDKNGDGQLTAEEIRPTFNPGRERGNPEEMPARMMEQFDRNGDGKLSPDEFPERLRSAFAQIDANGDGFVTKDELTKFFQSRGGRPDGPPRFQDR